MKEKHWWFYHVLKSCNVQRAQLTPSPSTTTTNFYRTCIFSDKTACCFSCTAFLLYDQRKLMLTKFKLVNTGKIISIKAFMIHRFLHRIFFLKNSKYFERVCQKHYVIHLHIFKAEKKNTFLKQKKRINMSLMGVNPSSPMIILVH